MLKLECSRCGDQFESSARRVDFPVYCGECLLSKELLDAMKPGATVPEYADCVPEPTPEPSCDSASVEATTELIVQLESDVAAREKQIDFLEAREKALQGQLDAATEREKVFTTAVLEAGGVVADLLARLEVLRSAQKEAVRHGKFQKERGDRLAERVVRLMRAEPVFKRLAHERFTEILELRNEIRELKTRGIFGRLFSRDTKLWC
jgi:hypothetical protein